MNEFALAVVYRKSLSTLSALFLLSVLLGVTANSNATGGGRSLRQPESFGSVNTTSYLRFDPTFNGLGYRLERFDDQVNTIPSAMALAPDGKVLVAAPVSGGRFGMMRFNSNGTLDMGFAGDGKLIVDMNLQITSLVVQPDGKMIAVGGGTLLRFNADGSTDAPFGGGGGVVNLGGAINKISLRPDGKIVAAGSAANAGGGSDFAIARLNSDGSLDQTFNGGLVTTQLLSSNSIVSFGFQPDGKIMAAGFTNNTSVRQLALLRFNSDGTMDTSFDSDGKKATDLLPAPDAIANLGMAVQDDGKVVVAGTRQNLGGWFVGRYNSDGSVDSTFSGDGLTESKFPMTPGNTGSPTKVFILPDGRIIVGGADRADSLLKTQKIAFARYLVDGSPDRSFDGDGRARFNFPATPAEYPIDFDLDAQGRVVATAATTNGGSDFRIGVMRAAFGPERPFTTEFDQNGDGRADLMVYRPSTNTWYTQSSAGFSGQQFGMAGDAIVPTDFDGDGTTDLGIFRPSSGQWFYSGQTSGATSWGQAGDVTMPADLDGDGLPELIAFRASMNAWYIRTPDFSFETIQFGAANDKPVRGDFDGDGAFDIAMYNLSSYVWRVRSWTGSVSAITWGEDGDIPAPADYDGDGATDIAVFRPSTGRWYIIGSSAGWMNWWTWGVAGDVPVPADYDGDRKADIAVFRPSDGTWYIVNSADQSLYFRPFGQTGDLPIPSAYIY